MTGELRETIALAGIEGYTGTSPWTHGVDETWLRVADAVMAVLPPLVPEGMTPDRLREIADWTPTWESATEGDLLRWADAIESSGGGAGDREAPGPAGPGADTLPGEALDTPSRPDPFPVGCRVRLGQFEGEVTPNDSTGFADHVRVEWDDGAGPGLYPPGELTRLDAAAPVGVESSTGDGGGEARRRTRAEITADFEAGTRTIREWVGRGSVHGPHLVEELDAWLDYFGGSGCADPRVPSPVVPEGHEVVVLPSDEARGWYDAADGMIVDHGCRSVDPCSACVERWRAQADLIETVTGCRRVAPWMRKDADR